MHQTIFLLALLPLLIPQSVAAASVPQTPVDTGSKVLNHQISNFYKCVSDTHKDPPPLFVVDSCFNNNVSTNGHLFTPNFSFEIPFHHFEEQPPSIIVHSFNHHHHFFIFHHHFRVLH